MKICVGGRNLSGIELCKKSSRNVALHENDTTLPLLDSTT